MCISNKANTLFFCDNASINQTGPQAYAVEHSCFITSISAGLGKGSASWRFFFAVKVKSLKKKCYVHRP